MPIKEFSGEQTLKNVVRNRGHKWPDTARTAKRLVPVATPAFRPSFRLRPQERIYTIGSCFARNIEQALAALGFDVPATGIALPWHVYAQTFLSAVTLPPLTLSNELLNKYVPHAITNELKWVFEDGGAFPYDTALIQISDHLYGDPHVTFQWAAPLEVVKRHRRMVMDSFETLRGSRIVVITLGLAEAWWDSRAGLYLNVTPPLQAVRADPGRFALHILDHGDVVSAFEQSYAILRKVCPADFKILLTVSPVPLNATFTDEDVLVANMYGKSVLRAAAQDIAYSHDNVDYFPSYETVMLSERHCAWQEDNRHVDAAMVDFIVERMVRAYLPDAHADARNSEAVFPSPRPSYGELRSIADILAKHTGR